ncbi:MAG TPA: UDP-N-acetylglucosamine 1-carboxyvinyltransferase, partial [Candidatus Krumholzibacteria bacterium]|nr:UDP-N-acetylglucosamine 1-carboxyvinyltransferase [Candidatus Krumholzibacteria bacterium]
MDRFLIHGPCTLSGSVDVSGAKNAVLPLMAATLLSRGVSRIRNVPNLRDTRTMGKVLETLGAQVTREGDSLIIDSSGVVGVEAPYELVKTMRASVYVLGPLLSAMGTAKVSLPGGCAWGPRPIDLHLKGMEMLGAQVELEGGYVVAKRPGSRLRGGTMDFSTSSVGATANVLMAAVLAEGHTVLENAAREPEVAQLAEALVAAGAKIDGIGSTRLSIEGVKEIAPLQVSVIPDRIEAGTFLCAAAILRSKLKVNKVRPAHLGATIDVLQSCGCSFEIASDAIEIDGREADRALNAVTR